MSLVAPLRRFTTACTPASTEATLASEPFA
jgi:hypothetical protein